MRKRQESELNMFGVFSMVQNSVLKVKKKNGSCPDENE